MAREANVKAIKWVLALLAAYAVVVVLFESLLGYFQPAGGSTLVITTTDDGGRPHQRVLGRLESGGRLYVAANHWPRAWYEQALRHPAVTVADGGASREFVAVPVSAEEAARLDREHATGLVFRLLTGFPPRRFVRLDPAPAAPAEALDDVPVPPFAG
jgi:hypothetical protein